MSIRAAVISDTHVGQRISTYPSKLLSILRESDLIIHAGDHTSSSALETLLSTGEVRAIRGNMDDLTVSSKLPEKLLFDIEGIRVGVIHGWGAPVGLANRVRETFRETVPPPDIIIFGHSHSPHDELIDGVRMLNPGAVCGNQSGKNGSYGILDISVNSIMWELANIEI